MLDNLHVQRYRGMNEFALTGSGRVNLIVGRNDSGKTSLLEAIGLLMTGDPRYLRRSVRNRIPRVPADEHRILRHAFYQGRSDEPLQVDGVLNELTLSASAEIRRVKGEEAVQLESENEDDTSEPSDSLLQPAHEIVIAVVANNGAKTTIHQTLQSKGLPVRSRRQFADDNFPVVPSLVWLGTNRAEASSIASRYSALFRQGGADVLNTVLKDIEPRLSSLLVLTERSETASRFSYAVLEVDVGLPQPLPLDSMGEGFGSIIAVLSGIAAASDGLCLIDEIENGIHYSVLERLWRSVGTAADRFSSQVWATTHSHDCISSAYDAFADKPELLQVHRLDRSDERGGTVVAHTFDYDMLGRALERGLEVR